MPARRILPDRGNGVGIGFEVALGIGAGPGGLAQHVEAGGKAPVFLGIHALHGFVDGPTHNKDLPHQPHRCTHGLPHKGLASTRDQALQAAVAVAQHRLAQHQPPGRTVDEQARRLPLMPAPVRIGQLVGDEQVGSLRIRHPQKRLGQR